MAIHMSIRLAWHNEGYEIDVKLCAYTSSEMDAALKMWESMREEIARDTAYDRWSSGAGAVGKPGDPLHPYLEEWKKITRDYNIIIGTLHT